MKKKLFFYSLLIITVVLQTLLVFLVKKPVEYSLVITNLNNYTNKALLAPKTLDFRPINAKQLEQKYQKTIYNFYYYIDQDYLVINDHEVCLRIASEFLN